MPYKNKEDTKAASKRWATLNREKKRAQNQAYHKRYPNKVAAKRREHRRKRRHLSLANVARYRARLLNATPQWANQAAISQIYEMAARLGPDYHVDHIIPLSSPEVCGLHVETNLNIITKTDNLRKGNRIEFPVCH
jgi:hypothetical protein